MRPETAKWLADVRSSATFILGAVEGKELADYEADALLRAGVERHFEIIGEAVRRVADSDPETAAGIGDYPRVIAFRNVLIHGYDLVDHPTVWAVIRESLPALVTEVERLLRESEADGDGDTSKQTT